MKRVELVAGESHRNLRKGLIPAVDLHPSEGVAHEVLNLRPWGSPLDLVSCVRFPPGVAGILRSRISEDFEKLSGLNSTVVPLPLGLRVTPTFREDFRCFAVEVDLYSDEDVAMIKLWHPYLDLEQHPAQTEAESRKAQFTLKLTGLLTELPTVMEAYKSLDQDLLFKAANISQLMVVTFAEEERHTFPVDISAERNDHVCIEQFMPRAERNRLDEHALTLPRCPWLNPSGVTAPLRLFREERTRDYSVATKAEIRACEMAMLSILKRGRMEWAELDVHSALEAFMLEEALKPNTTVPNAQAVLSNNEQKIVKVIGEQATDLFDDAASDLSDQLFGDDHTLDEKHFLEDKTAVKRRKDRKPTGEEMVAAGVGGDDQAGRMALEQEFNELAESAVRQILERDIEDDFFSGAVLEEPE
ncbi:TAFII55 protein [Gregarina niphandrodes]|uniref:TAFII55 protein n=1 Tax=Gregarina niphandrodes TaxID=110365 RepID=A0A023BD43_GRENI|nr:TAFII55 protein [Gregarina niphandrodes]EZG86044.1 TAFII55 protein [Gregarina niphandrodes]|eukprot:XP_011128799.1 TAFII55 protein [Gregarina niphandrodes]